MPTNWHVRIPGKNVDALLTDLGPSREVLVHGLAGPGAPAAFSNPHDYLLTDALGAPIAEYSVLAWAFDDEQGATVYDIHNGAFRQLTVTHSGEEPTVRHQITVLLEGLTQSPPPHPHPQTHSPAP